MEVKEGYKQTEVGLIPEDWELVSFDKAFAFMTSATYSRAEISTVGDCGYIHYGDIHTQWNHFLDFNQTSLPRISHDKVKAYPHVKEGDLIMADASEDYIGIGKCVEVRNLNDQKAISGLHTFLLRCKGVIANGYKAYLHSNNLIKTQFDRLATGLKVYGVSKSNLKLIMIPLPPTKEEQEAIAKALSDADALIESLEQLIAKKRQIKQGAMQELLTGKKRLPGFEEGWVNAQLGNVATFYKGKGLPKSDLDSYGSTKCIHYGELFTKHPAIITTIRNKTNISSNLFHSKESDVLMPTSDVTPNGLATASCIMEDKVIIGGDVLVIRPETSKLSGPFLSFVIRQSRKQIMQLVTGITVFHLYGSGMAKFLLRLPTDIKEQYEITKVLTDMDSELDSLNAKLSKARQVKQGMMHNLLTGKIRLI